MRPILLAKARRRQAGAAAIQVVNNPRRLQKVLYRRPHGKVWEEKTWDWAPGADRGAG